MYSVDERLADAIRLGRTQECEQLLLRGASVRFRKLEGSGCDYALHSAAYYGFIDICELLLNHGADVNDEKDPPYNLTALNLAAGCGRTEVCEFLINRGAKVNRFAPLFDAARFGFFDTCVLLLKYGADVNSTDKRNFENGDGYWTALHTATFYDKHKVCKLLLENGADDGIPNRKGETAADFAKKSNNPEIKNTFKHLFPFERRLYLLCLSIAN